MKQTPEQRDKYYRKHYGLSLTEVDALFTANGNVCEICGRPPGSHRLSIDHDHRIARSKIVTTKALLGWEAAVTVEGLMTVFPGASRKIARAAARLWLLRRSIRGALCHRCNRALQLLSDNAKSALNAASYLDKRHGAIIA